MRQAIFEDETIQVQNNVQNIKSMNNCFNIFIF